MTAPNKQKIEHLKQWIRWNNGIFEGKPSLADLIYLDPPWNSNRIYNITVDKGANAVKGHTAQETAFTDIWEWDDGSAERVQMLKEAGNIIHPGHPKYPLRKGGQSHGEFGEHPPRNRRAGVSRLHGRTISLLPRTALRHRLHLSALRSNHVPLLETKIKNKK